MIFHNRQKDIHFVYKWTHCTMRRVHVLYKIVALLNLFLKISPFGFPYNLPFIIYITVIALLLFTPIHSDSITTLCHLKMCGYYLKIVIYKSKNWFLKSSCELKNTQRDFEGPIWGKSTSVEQAWKSCQKIFQKNLS